MQAPSLDLLTLALVALLNPVVAAVGYRMGRAADQPQKLVLAGFVAGIAGMAAVWLAAKLGLVPARWLAGPAGLFVLKIAVGLGWAALGWRRR